MKKLFILFFTAAVLLLQNGLCQAAEIQNKIELETKDGSVLHGNYYTSNAKKAPKYPHPTVLLLHSLAYSSSYYDSLRNALLAAGFEVITFDFRGHGTSIEGPNFSKKSWKYFSAKDYAKFPNDVKEVLDYVKSHYKANLNDLIIVGADIGANTAVLAGNLLTPKPSALVLISPAMTFKGLYIPVTLAEIGTMPILFSACSKNADSMREQNQLVRFAQGKYDVKNYPNGGGGNLMLNTNPQITADIVNWLVGLYK